MRDWLTHQGITFFIEIIGTISFAVSGTFAAIQKKLDPFGVMIIAFVTAVGGGTIRDLLLDTPVFWMYDMTTCAVIFFSCVLAMIFKSIENNFKVMFFIFDSLGLGFFTIVGIQKGIDANLHPIICLTLGTITGCFGGVLRDILINRIPLLLRKEIYATACILGGVLYLLLSQYFLFSVLWVQLLTISTIVSIRIVAVKYDIQIPKFYLSDKNHIK